MNELTQQTFNYFALPDDIAVEARAVAERVKMRLRRTAEDIVEIGRELVGIKDKLGHGNFLPWIEAEFEMHRDTANSFMRVFSRFGQMSEIPTFQPSILYQLAAPSTPDSIIEKATEKAESGEKVSVEDIKRWKQEAAVSKLEAESLKESLDAAQCQIVELSSREPETITREVLPADYESADRDSGYSQKA